MAAPAAATTPVRAARARSRPRSGQRCDPGRRHEYLTKYRLDCRGRRLRRATLAALRHGQPFFLDSRGRIDARNALEAFDATVARLPGVRLRKGAVGPLEDGTPVVMAASAQRSRLTRAQRAVLGRVLEPPGPAHVSAVSPQEAAGLVNLAFDARDRLIGHGLEFKHGLQLTFPDTNDDPAGKLPSVAGYASPGWLQPAAKFPGCTVAITPVGRSEPLRLLRRIMLHEVFHCASFEYVSSLAEYLRIPDWLMEGGAEWVASQVASEWNGIDVTDHLWDNWLHHPEDDLGGRTYDGMGLWALLAQTGRDPFTLLPGAFRAAGAGGDHQAYLAATASAPPLFFDTWGPGFVRSSVLGPIWGLTGTGIPSSSPPHTVINEGTTWIRSADNRGAYGSDLSLEADVIDIQASVAHGSLHDSGGDHKLQSELLLTEPDATCPRGEINGRPVNGGAGGLVSLGFQDGSVQVIGRSLDDECEREGKGAIVPREHACQVLKQAGVAGLVGGPGTYQFTTHTRQAGAVISSCIYIDTHEKDHPGQGFSLQLTTSSKAKPRQIRRRLASFLNRGGYQRIAGIGSLAGVKDGPDGPAVIYFALGRTIAMCAGPHVITAAHRIAAVLRR